MRIDRLEDAVKEAKRFLAAAKKVQRQDIHPWAVPGKDAAAAKRASLDLSMALARMRTDTQ